jgi:hypothetical protein
MKKLLVILTLMLAIVGSALAQKPTNLPPGSKVYLEPMDGFETYLAAALQKKKVPVKMVGDKDSADFVITGTAEHIKAGWAKIVFSGNIHSDEQASISVMSVKTSEVVFAYAVNKKNTLHGMQTSAEACAKHLYGHIKGDE